MQNKHFNIDIKMAGKRIKALFMSTVLLIGTFSMLLLTGCSSDTGYDDDRISIVCTTFPQYDWLSQIIGDNSDKFRFHQQTCLCMSEASLMRGFLMR